jgi:Family of unknown function (DUF6714)
MDMKHSTQTELQNPMEELIGKVERAFADVEYPGDDDLTNSTYGEEPAALIWEFRGKIDRTQLDAYFLNYAPNGWGSGTALSFFSDDAFRFYLPVYLIADIRGELWGPDPSSRLCSFRERAQAKFAKFNAAQVSAVVTYLWWKLEAEGGHDETIEQALETYWLVRKMDTQD